MFPKRHYFNFNHHPLRKWFDYHRFTILGVFTLLFFIAPQTPHLLISPWVEQSIYIALITTSAINLMQTRRKKIIFACLAVISSIILFVPRIFGGENKTYEVFIFLTFTVYFYFIIHNLFKQMRMIKKVDEQLIIASVTGYLLLGTMAFLIFGTIEMMEPGSFTNTAKILQEYPDHDSIMEMIKINTNLFNDLYYFSFVTITTLGYGDIAPVSQLARKAVVITSIVGPFYMAVVVATIVGKFSSAKENSN